MSVTMGFLAIEEIRWHTKAAHVVRKWHRFRGLNDYQPIASRNHTVLLPSCERCHIVTFLESRVLRQHHFAHTISVNWLHITIHSTQRKSYHARASQQAWTLCLCLSLSLFLDIFLFLFPVGCGAWQCLCAKQKQRWWSGRGEKKTDSWTYLTRGEGRNVRGIVFLHAWAHVWIWRQIKVFHKHIIGTILWELQAQLAGTNLQIRVLHLPHHIVLENHLLVAHLWDLKWAHSQDLEEVEEEEEAEAHQLKEKLTSSRERRTSPAQEEKFLLPPKKISSSNLRENPAHFETGTVTLELGPVLNVHPQVGESFNCAIIPKKDRRDVCNGRSTDGHCLVLGFWSRVVVLRARIQESVFIRQFRHPRHSPTLTFSLVKNSKEYQLRPPVKSPRQLDQWFSLANQSRREIFILFFGSLTRSFSLQWWVTLTLNP